MDSYLQDRLATQASRALLVQEEVRPLVSTSVDGMVKGAVVTMRIRVIIWDQMQLHVFKFLEMFVDSHIQLAITVMVKPSQIAFLVHTIRCAIGTMLLKDV